MVLEIFWGSVSPGKHKKSKNKYAEDLNRPFPKDIQMANKYIKEYSMSLIIREIQIKTTMRYYLIPVSKAIIKKTTNNKY